MEKIKISYGSSLIPKAAQPETEPTPAPGGQSILHYLSQYDFILLSILIENKAPMYVHMGFY